MHVQKLVLDKNTTVGFREWGPKEGTPLVFFHGFPGCSIQGAMFADVCEDLNLRILSIDRLGYGQTCSSQGFDAYKLFIEKMKLESFYVFGVSGGAPTAVRISEMFPRQVLGLGIICGLIPLQNNENKFSYKQRQALKTLSVLPTPVLKGLLSVLDYPALRDAFMKKLLHSLPEPDKQLFQRDDLLALLNESMLKSREQGVAGIVKDIQHYASDWLGSSRNFQGPVWVWHGERDSILPVKMASAWKAIYPESYFKIVPDQGHYSLAVNVIPTELKTIFARG